ncbi:3-keto-disaccharide hydrolase [Oleiharenicola lentus]|uniref:3-keto-disaccharide hydrolase n=1 Tax=Oleiharenicola lentus TaxID=2508720 RepID=UPI003F67FB64
MTPYPTLTRRWLPGLACSLFVASLLTAAEPKAPKAPPASPPLPAATASAFENSATGWIDLLAKNDLSDWQRERYPATKPLGETNPWKFDAATKTLLCDAAGIHEMLLHRTAQGDGIFHVEFRFVGWPAKPNSGAFVRTLPDASTWYQAQLAPSGLGMVFGQVPSGEAKPKRVSAGARYPELLRAAGEWNVMEITTRGTELTLWLNGHVTATSNDITTLRGHVGLEAEFNAIEFRQLKFKPLP